jgi:hypothetical protein
MLILWSMEKITDKEPLSEIYADLDLDAAYDLLTEEEVDDLYRREKSCSRRFYGGSRHDEDGDLAAMLEVCHG